MAVLGEALLIAGLLLLAPQAWPLLLAAAPAIMFWRDVLMWLQRAGPMPRRVSVPDTFRLASAPAAALAFLARIRRLEEKPQTWPTAGSLWLFALVALAAALLAG